MSELSTLLVSDLILLCSLIFSQPLYFSYFIFFSPYLFKIFSFLSPLFLTTTLSILSFFTLCPSFSDIRLPESKIITCLLTYYQTLIETLRSDVDHDRSDCFGCLELLEACKMVFETSSSVEIRVKNYPHEAREDHFDKDLDEKPEQFTRPETNQVKAVVKIFEDFLQDKEGVENYSMKKRDKQVKSPRVESKEMCPKTSDPKAVTKTMVNSHRLSENGGDYNYNLGMMRREKEWKRTLACKLFEERRADDASHGDEGMDLLWEEYETESNKAQHKSSSNKVDDDYNRIDQYDYDDESVSQLCCLQALKFSSGRMNLGIGRSNIVKISKALKGFGWLHHVSNRHGKKRYPA